MTLDDFFRMRHITADNIDEFIKQCRYQGAIGGDYDYQCSPKGVELDAVHEYNRPELHIKRKFYTWQEVKDRLNGADQLRWEI